MFSSKLIVPVVGAMGALCSVGLGGAAAAGRGTSSASSATSASQTLVVSDVLATNVLVGRSVQVSGWVTPTIATERVRLQERQGRGWYDVSAPRTVAGGGFTLAFRPRSIGSAALRVQSSGPAGVSDSAGAAIEVFHAVLASWYGPGGRTACGEELTSRTLGVANRTLPCGTLVTLRYGQRTLRVPVIDRGPYVAGRDYDLTYATKRALDANDLTVVWASR